MNNNDKKWKTINYNNPVNSPTSNKRSFTLTNRANIVPISPSTQTSTPFPIPSSSSGPLNPILSSNSPNSPNSPNDNVIVNINVNDSKGMDGMNLSSSPLSENIVTIDSTTNNTVITSIAPLSAVSSSSS